MENRIHSILDNLTNDKLTTKSVYKYHRINKFLYDLLINNEIWFSDPYSFNDPFDCNLTIDGNNTPEQIKNYFKIANWNKSRDIDETIQQLIATNFQDQEAFQKKINSISKQVIGKLGLTCFTQTKDNLLMWAHYTEDHKGICLEFDHSKDLEFFRPFKKVEYDKVYPTYNYYNDKKNVVGQLMLHKSDHWKYEKEVRLIKKKTGLYTFKPECLTGIYFGVRTPNEQIKTIKKLVQGQEKYSQTKFFKGTIDTKDYKIIFEDV
ncbi:DUF2971 domain-containing protein [Flavobacterium fluviatile]|uniref:DUF2971 domain-containing protein n=1 Tax=Flavobacterium fluviatile TaxID=1862387 RepID=UPI0013CFB75A|nr:DUF2971 domain-containing protein [Flavobacterium fluviatile]